MVPECLVLGVAVPELEGDAAKDQSEQHDQDREVNRRDDDGESERKGREERNATEHQPGLVAVPDWRDGVHHELREAVSGASP